MPRLLYILPAFLIIVSSLVIFQNMAPKPSTSNPTPPRSDFQEEKTGYSDVLFTGPKYTLDSPSECKEENYKDEFNRNQFTITCKKDKFTVIINPQSAGRGIYWQGDILQEVIKAANINIDYATYISNEKTPGENSFSSYQISGIKNNLDTDYQIQAIYDNYSNEAQTYVNQILSTFKFVENSSQSCGGSKNIVCPTGQKCILIDPLPGASGTCTSN